MLSPKKKARRLTRRAKGKKKMLEYDNDEGTSDQSEFDGAMSSDEGTRELSSDLAKRAIKSTNERLRRSTRHKNPIIWYGYNEYMVPIDHGGRNRSISCK